jgi:hypothetical protein
VIAIAVGVVVALAIRPGRAQAETYRTEMLIVDGASLAVAFASSAAPEGPARTAALAISAVGLLAGAGVVHAAHGNYGRGGISFGLRAGPIAIASGLAALCASGEEGTKAAPVCIALSALVGTALMVTGIVLDYTVVADIPDTAQARARPIMLSWGRSF